MGHQARNGTFLPFTIGLFRVRTFRVTKSLPTRRLVRFYSSKAHTNIGRKGRTQKILNTYTKKMFSRENLTAIRRRGAHQ